MYFAVDILEQKFKNQRLKKRQKRVSDGTNSPIAAPHTHICGDHRTLRVGWKSGM